MARTTPALKDYNPEEDNFSAKHPHAPAGWSPTSEKKIGAEVAVPSKVSESGFMSAGLHDENAQGLGEPSPYLKKALSKKPGDRTPQEKEALKVRSRAEEITTKAGGKVMGGIMTDLIAEERAPGIGRREAKAALGYYDESAKTLAEGGRAPDGSKLDPASGKPASSVKSTSKAATGATAPQVAPVRDGAATSGGTINSGRKTVSVPGKPAAPSTPNAPTDWKSQATRLMNGQPMADPAAPSTDPADLPDGAHPAIKSTGFAMRTMPDGTVRTASGLSADGSSVMHDFATKDAAMAYYRPPATPAAPAAAVPGQAPVAAPAAPAPVAPPPNGVTPAAMDFLKTGQAPAALDYINNPAPAAPAQQTPAAARTTSPTAKLEMAGGTPGATPGAAPVAPPAPADPAPAAAPNNIAGLSSGEILGQVTGATPTPGMPQVGFGAGVGELWNRLSKNAVWNSTGAVNYGGPTKNPFTPDRPDYSKGTPKPNGFQQDAEKLVVTR